MSTRTKAATDAKRFTTKVAVVVNEKENTLTASWLGHFILKQEKLPLSSVVIRRAVACIEDEETRLRLCTKRGLIEQMANESAANGDGRLFAAELEKYNEPFAKKAKKGDSFEVAVAPEGAKTLLADVAPASAAAGTPPVASPNKRGPIPKKAKPEPAKAEPSPPASDDAEGEDG